MLFLFLSLNITYLLFCLFSLRISFDQLSTRFDSVRFFRHVVLPGSFSIFSQPSSIICFRYGRKKCLGQTAYFVHNIEQLELRNLYVGPSSLFALHGTKCQLLMVFFSLLLSCAWVTSLPEGVVLGFIRGIHTTQTQSVREQAKCEIVTLKLYGFYIFMILIGQIVTKSTPIQVTSNFWSLVVQNYILHFGICQLY